MVELDGVSFFGSIIAAILTMMVLSYIIGDNPLFRFAMHVFIGIAAGYAGAIAWHNILKPDLIDPILENGLTGLLNGYFFTGAEGRLIIGAWILVAMLLLKLSPTTARWGSLPMALMVGVGAAVVVGGAAMGTLIPQSSAAVATSARLPAFSQVSGEGIKRLINWMIIAAEPLFEVAILMIGTTATFAYFQFSAKRTPSGDGKRSVLMTWIANIGQVFIAITFGTIYAGALAATLVALSERMRFLVDWFAGLLSNF
jgi:hypothetical protein